MGGEDYAVEALRQRLLAGMATVVQRSQRITTIVRELQAEIEQLRTERAAYLEGKPASRARHSQSASAARTERAWELGRRRQAEHLREEVETAEGRLLTELDALTSANSDAANLQGRIEAIDASIAKRSRERRKGSLERDDERQLDRLTGHGPQD